MLALQVNTLLADSFSKMLNTLRTNYWKIKFC